MLGIDQNGRAVCTAIGLCAHNIYICLYGGHAFCVRQPRLLRSERLGNCLTCFKSPVVLRLELSEDIAIHLYSLIVSAAAMPAFRGCGLWDGCWFNVHPIVICAMRIPYRLKAKELSRTQWRACLKQINWWLWVEMLLLLNRFIRGLLILLRFMRVPLTV